MCALVDSWLSGLKKAPELCSKRLFLRPICAGDAHFIQVNINDKRMADNLSYTPHPYTIEMAENWVNSVNRGMQFDQCCYWTLCEKNSRKCLGSIGLSLQKEQESGELHYWISVEEWGRGYCTEGSKVAISYFFDALKMHRLAVTHREFNAASKKVIKKCHFICEGKQREGLKRLGKFENVILYSLLKHEYFALKSKGLY